MSDERWLTIDKAREKADVSRRTVYSWIKAGKLTTRRTVGGSVRILESSLWQRQSEDSARTEASQ